MPHTLEGDCPRRWQNTHLVLVAVSIGRILDVLDFHIEVLMEFIIQSIVVFFREEHCGSQPLIRDSTKTAHRSLENEYFGFRAAEKGHAKQRTAVPAFLAFLNENNELLVIAFRSENIEIIEIPDVIVLCVFCITNIHKNFRCRDTKTCKNLLKCGFDLYSSLLYTCRIYGEFRIQTLVGLAAVSLPECGY